MNILSFYTSFGWITLFEKNNLITSIKFGKGKNIGNSAFLKKLKKQIIEYSKGRRKKFSVKLNIKGTVLQKKMAARRDHDNLPDARRNLPGRKKNLPEKSRKNLQGKK